ncbi:uncharacterized protein METZ01_LOCUS258911 [marine metagenome]|uniref:Uncharacterized protein n=1 Tax=marine metagenome TaxID=408172 RepID=A0A382J3T4_9ZZZZ
MDLHIEYEHHLLLLTTKQTSILLLQLLRPSLANTFLKIPSSAPLIL